MVKHIKENTYYQLLLHSTDIDTFYTKLIQHSDFQKFAISEEVIREFDDVMEYAIMYYAGIAKADLYDGMICTLKEITAIMQTDITLSQKVSIVKAIYEFYLVTI